MDNKVVNYTMLENVKKLIINDQSDNKKLFDTLYINELDIEKEFYNIFNTTFVKAIKTMNITFKSSLLRYDIKKIFNEIYSKLQQNNIYIPMNFTKRIKKLLPQETDIIENDIDYKLIIKKDNFNCLNINIIKYEK